MKAVALTCLALVASVEGHGYVSSPASRSYKCKLNENSNCGSVQYEPQSVEGPDRFPGTGPADGHLAGVGKWPPLDEQSPGRWSKHSVRPGSMTFTWTFTAAHVTNDWRYFMTVPGWNQNAPLARSSFDLTPFCTVSGNMARPPMSVSHQCTMPTRSGYHVVLAVWDVGDTVNSFYQAIDMDFGGSNPSPPVPVPPVPVPVPPVPVPVPPAPVPVPPVPVPVPVPVPMPSPSGCTSFVPVWGNCKGRESCCESGTRCNVQSQWYAQCVPGGNTPPAPVPVPVPVPVPAPVPVPVPVPVPSPPSGCTSHIPVWGNCKGRESCCEGGTRCNVQSQWYAQCVPGAATPSTQPSGCPYTIQKWGNCLAKPMCCTSGTSCHAVSSWYAQCR